MSSEAKKKLLLAKRKKVVLSAESAVSSGSTLLNLACTDRPDLAFLKGRYYLVVGDSAAGKTFLLHTVAAEICQNPGFDEHKIIYDDVENGVNFNIEKLFGKEAAKRIRAPRYKNGEPVPSEKVEDFYGNIMGLIEDGEKFVYFLDSQDALDSIAAEKKFKKQRKQHEEENEVKGSYGTEKAKYHSENLRRVIGGLRRTGSILFFVSQTRDNLGFSFDPKTRSGGKSMKFYNTLELWLSLAGSIKRKINGIDRTIGVKSLIEVKKNRFTGKIGKDRAVIVPIYHSYGMDDIGSCVEYLITEKRWGEIKRKKEKDAGPDLEEKKKSRKKIYNAHDILFEGTKDAIVQYIEEEDLEPRLREVVTEVWQDIEARCEVKRKKRYD